MNFEWPASSLHLIVSYITRSNKYWLMEKINAIIFFVFVTFPFNSVDHLQVRQSTCTYFLMFIPSLLSCSPNNKFPLYWTRTWKNWHTYWHREAVRSILSWTLQTIPVVIQTDHSSLNSSLGTFTSERKDFSRSKLIHPSILNGFLPNYSCWVLFA